MLHPLAKPLLLWAVFLAHLAVAFGTSGVLGSRPPFTNSWNNCFDDLIDFGDTAVDTLTCCDSKPMTLPNDINRFTRLTSISLANCKLTGTIPQNLMTLSTLREINLSGNQFVSTIPDGIERLSLLTRMDVNNNRLSGSIPSKLSSLIYLQRFAGRNNRFHGPYPQVRIMETIIILIRIEADLKYFSDEEICDEQHLMKYHSQLI
jgi:hypothetical protein